MGSVFVAIDLKSFYASVECAERGLDPLDTNLVVADLERTEKTICLAVSPSLKSYGISGRPRLFEVVQKVREINYSRRKNAERHVLRGESYLDSELKASPSLALGYVTAVPRMALYIEYSTRIYQIYLKYVAKEDIHVYSIDEVFIDATHYLASNKMSPRDFAMTMIYDVLSNTGITATAGIGSNLYLAKVAMDIEAKHISPDKDGVRIAELDELSYRRKLWTHTPLIDFWRVGRGYSAKLEAQGLMTMGDIARRSIDDEDSLYRLFGVNAELLIDHAWGWEPCTMAEIKAYKPQSSSMGSGQVLQCPYSHEKAALIVKEMAQSLVLDLVDKGLVTNQVTLVVCYDNNNLIDSAYKGEVTTDHYGKAVPKSVHGSLNLQSMTNSGVLITKAFLSIYERITDKKLTVRRIYVTASRTAPKSEASLYAPVQMELFDDPDEIETQKKEFEKEEKRLKAILEIQRRFGKNSILKGTSFEEGAMAKTRNQQIGGHRK